MHRARLLATALLSLGLVGVGFAAPAAAGEQLSKKELRQEANGICEAASTALSAIFDDAFGEVSNLAEIPEPVIAAAIELALPVFRDSLDAVEELDGPAAFDRRVDRMLDQYRTVADEIEDEPAIAFAEDENIWVRPDKAARKLGLRECVQG